VQTGQVGTGQNRAELLTQQVWTLKAQADSAHAQKWIGLVCHRYIGQWFVAAHIQRAHHQIVPGTHDTGDGAVSGNLLGMAGGAAAFQIKELGAQ